MIRLLFSIIFLFTIGFHVEAAGQKVPRKFRITIKKGDYYFDNLVFTKAIYFYEKALSMGESAGDSALSKTRLKIADACRYINDSHNAVKQYELLEGKGVMGELDKMYFAFALMQEGHLEKAIEVSTQIDIKLARLEQLSQLESVETETQNYEITNHWLNGPTDDFSPIYFKDGLVFCSNREDELLIRKKYTWDQSYFLDLYYVPMDKYLGDAELFESDINSPYHEGPATFSMDERRVVFTRSNMDNGKIARSKDGTNKLKLYTAEKAEGKNSWSKPEELWFNSDEYSTGHPTLTSDGLTMYFASDMEGSRGEADIFVSRWEDDKWSEPVSLGAPVNTSEDELFPFIYQDSILYFASKGHLGWGGFDIYRINLNNPEALVENLGPPINTTSDDFGLIRKGNVGFISSNRPGGKGGDDIYQFIYTPAALASKSYLAALTVRDKETHEVIPDVGVFIADNVSDTPVPYSKVDDKYIFKIKEDAEYMAEALHMQYFSDQLRIAFDTPESDTLFIDLNMQKLEVGKAIALKNIYYDLDKAEISPAGAKELNRLVQIMEDNPSFKIELSAHTDSRGTNEYNFDLSQRRAESAVRYILSKGISNKRIVARGYGETQLINGCVDGKNCSESDHSLNRRTEFTIQHIEVASTSP